MQAQSIQLSGGYAKLPEHFYARLDPTPVAGPTLIEVNRPLAAELGMTLDSLSAESLAAYFSGNARLPGAEPIATAYAGHQFGHFVPQLGDGRAILLGEVRDLRGNLRELQLKGSGRTPYSRSGDGRAALGPVLREYLVSEAMHALGVPTTRSLAAVASGETVYREEALPGAVLTRVAASHVRVGTFQFFAARGDVEATRRLADYCIARHYPEAATAEQPYLALLAAVVDRQAALVAQWLRVGFIHGVMNTDNMAISGETIDFGPCAFLDAYDPATVFSSIDSRGRYAYGNQVHAAHWDLARFAETLLPLIAAAPERAAEAATAVLEGFGPRFTRASLEHMRAKLGLAVPDEGDADLVQALLDAMQRTGADFTLSFRALCDDRWPEGADEWGARWQARVAREDRSPDERRASMRRVNPAYIPRNHRVEEVIVAATRHADYTPFRSLLEVVTHPYEEQPAHAAYRAAPRPEERVLRTFCGT